MGSLKQLQFLEHLMATYGRSSLAMTIAVGLCYACTSAY